MRNIFIINAHIVDANGTYHNLDNFPQIVDSNNYQGDVDKARRRADGIFSETWGAMCKVDTRQIQTVVISDVFGNLLERKTTGAFPSV